MELKVDDYIIKVSYIPKPYGNKGRKKNTIWITNKIGEGMEINLDEFWEKEF